MITAVIVSDNMGDYTETMPIIDLDIDQEKAMVGFGVVVIGTFIDS